MTGEKFRTLRFEMGLTQTQLGQLMGMVQQAVGTIERVRGPTKQQAAFIGLLHWLHCQGLLDTYRVEEIKNKGD